MSIVYKCDCCGQTFCSEYYAGGYIDHVENFSNKSEYLATLDADEAIEKIVYRGNEIRYEYDIRDRLKCFCMQKFVS